MNASAGKYDINTATSSDVYKNGVIVSTLDSGFTHQTNMSEGLPDAYVIEVRFDANQTISAGTLIPTTFDGRIGEIISVTGTPSPGDLTILRDYLNLKY